MDKTICTKIKNKLGKVILKTIPECYTCQIHFDFYIADENRKKYKEQSFIDRTKIDSSIEASECIASNAGELINRNMTEVFKEYEDYGCEIKIKICIQDKNRNLLGFYEYKLRRNMKRQEDSVVFRKRKI